MAARVLPRTKEKIDIEALLKWTYLQELPKRPSANGPSAMACGYEPVRKYGELMPLAGLEQNAYGVVCDFNASSWPHDDAYIVHEAVGVLDELELGFPDPWRPIDDLGDLGDAGAAAIAQAVDVLTLKDADGVRRLKQKPRRLVFKHAILGGCPDWEAEKPERKFMIGANGKTRWFRKVWVDTPTPFKTTTRVEREVDGFNPKTKRPYDEAYPKYILDPDPVDSIIGRAEYEIWRSCLAFLVDELCGQMGDHEAVMTKRPERPWETDAPAKSFIWPDLSPRPPRPYGRPRALKFDVDGARRALERGA